jgi:hypothetical protein
MAAGERGVPDVAVRRGGDPVRSGSPGGVEHAHPAAARVHAAVDAALAGEPQHPAPVEGGGVEVDGGTVARQGIAVHRLAGRVDPHDRVQPAVGDPRGAVGPDDHAVRRRPVAQRDLRGPAGLRVEAPQAAGGLRGVPDGPIAGGRDVVGVGAVGHGELLEPHRRVGRHRGGRRRLGRWLGAAARSQHRHEREHAGHAPRPSAPPNDAGHVHRPILPSWRGASRTLGGYIRGG